MKLKLLPHLFKNVGLWVFTACLVISIVMRWWLHSNFLSLLFQLFSIIGLSISVLSKEKIEDELTMRLRLEACYVSFFISLVYQLLMMVAIISTDDTKGLDFSIIWIQLIIYQSYFSHKINKHSDEEFN